MAPYNLSTLHSMISLFFIPLARCGLNSNSALSLIDFLCKVGNCLLVVMHTLCLKAQTAQVYDIDRMFIFLVRKLLFRTYNWHKPRKMR